jgi:two-component system sensor histidine kinase SenX3
VAAYPRVVAELAFRQRRPGNAGQATSDPSGPPAAEPAASVTAAVPSAPELALAVLDALTAAVLVAGDDGTVLVANAAAGPLGLGGRGCPLPAALATLAADVRLDGATREQQLTLPALDNPVRLRRTGRTGPVVRVRASRAGEQGWVALVVEDLTESQRVDAVRRDFVANVSHELKTPVGALQLLAEAIGDASDDPNAVKRFASRISTEATRLGRLVQELIDLSRLQGAEPSEAFAPTELEKAVGEALDRTRLAAQVKHITVAVVTEPGPKLVVLGAERQLATAVANLLENAVHYSPERTRVVVGLRRRGGVVEVSVADEGIGISEADLERVFERFYRADPARSRATGGTGLGLAIVKHIATNHGGESTVWSAPGKGSTFTLRFPAYETPRRDEDTA